MSAIRSNAQAAAPSRCQDWPPPLDALRGLAFDENFDNDDAVGYPMGLSAWSTVLYVKLRGRRRKSKA